MKRILILIKGLGRGGAEQLLVSAAPYLNRSEFDYEVGYLLPHKNALAYELQQAGIRTHCLRGDVGFRWVSRLRRLVREERFDLLHVHSPYAAIGSRLLGGRRLPIVYTEHITWESYHPATYAMNMLTYGRNDHVFAVSDHVRDSVKYPWPLRFLPKPPVETLYHGLNLSTVHKWRYVNGVRGEFGIPSGAPLIATVANFKTHKGYPHLLKAALRIRQELPDVRFLFVGTGPIEKEIRRKAKDMGLDGTVIFTGFRDDAPRIAGAADVFALASIHEGLSIALVESLALGTPAVVTQTGGLAEVVKHGREGLVVPVGDPIALAESIMLLLRDEALRRRLGEQGRRRATDFDIRTAVARVESVYAELLK
jgi:glycosyltransferase involved in cell wall biosynthesis